MYDVSIHNGDDVRLIHDHRAASNAQKLVTASIVDAVNSISAFSFEMNPDNVGYDLISEFGTLVKVWNSKRGRYDFVGRVLQINPEMDDDGMMSKTVMCEDRLSFLHDSIQPYMLKRHFKGDATRSGLEAFIDLLLDTHNSQVEEYKRIYRGTVTVDPFKSSDNVTKGLNWETTYEAIMDKLVDSFGGFIVLRDEGGVLYLDYLESVGTTRDTAITVGRNMQSVKREINSGEIVTRIIPLGYRYSSNGESDSEERLTISLVNDGVIYVESAELVEKYGIRYGVVVFDDVTDPTILMRKGLEHFSENGGLVVSHDVSALELSLIGLDMDDFVLYDRYPVQNFALGIDEVLQIIKKTTNIIEAYDSSFEMGDVRRKMSDVTVGMAGSLNHVQQEVTYVGDRVTKTELAIVHATEQLAAKISRDEYNELGEQVQANSAAISLQADAISLRVTQADYEEGLEDKLDADAPSVGVETNSGITINTNGVYVEGKEIDLRTSDGDEFVNINESGINASSLIAPNVVPMYDGPSDLYIDPNWAESYLENGMYEPGDCLRSLKDALALLSNKSLPYAVNVYLRANIVEYGSAELIGCIAPYGVKIRAENTNAYPTIYGSITVKSCLGTVYVWNMRVNPPSGSNGIHAIGYGVLVKPDYVIIRGAGTSARGYCMCADEGAKIIANGCETYDNECSIVSKSGSMFISIDNKGNCNPYIESAAMRFYGTASSADAGSLWWYKYGSMVDIYQDENVTVDQGAASGSNIPTTTATYLATSTGSYKGSGSKYRTDVGQGWYKDIGRIRGCMWFNNSTIRSALSGKTIRSATLRLAMRSGVGRGVSVTVELCGTVANSGASSVAVTKSYGTIGTTEPGKITTITIPNEVITDLKNGTINGLMLYSSDTAGYKDRDYSKNYAMFGGHDVGDNAKPMLTIVYS